MGNAEGGTRTHTPLQEADFKSAASAIPPPRQKQKRRRADLNRCIGVLQTPALTSWLRRYNCANKTSISMERKTRFELATSSLARKHSTAELLPLLNRFYRLLPIQASHSWCRGGDLNSHGLTPTTPSRWRVYLFHHLGMAGAAGFEPTTCGFGDRCSSQLSYAPAIFSIAQIL